ncbi:uncharacterized protein LOC111628879 [Centruroides sculpturatus]|uniref:uncharacterized protein LOC111628879 n=1 Tax=Centruroides sculpturatus TaxID=218467 RepID=UPI000C6E7CD6|nr:uncharacterized protein LOC111628879 [Centruroides sculpturatus]
MYFKLLFFVFLLVIFKVLEVQTRSYYKHNWWKRRVIVPISNNGDELVDYDKRYGWNLNQVTSPKKFDFTKFDLESIIQDGTSLSGAEKISRNNREMGNDRLTSEVMTICKKCDLCQISSQEHKNQLICPSRDEEDRLVCIDIIKLCDGNSDCPLGEDELPAECLFYQAITFQMNMLENYIKFFHG